MLKRAALVLVVALSVLVLPSCSSNPKPDLSALPASAQHEYTIDQVVKLVNDSTTAAVTANHAGLLPKEGEKEILTINKLLLDVFSASPLPADWREVSLAIVAKRRLILPPFIDAAIAKYLTATLTALKGIS